MPEGRAARLRLYVSAVCVVAVAAITLSWRGMAPMPTAGVLLLATTALSVAMLPVKLPGGGDVSITAPVMLAILVLSGPTMLALVYAFVSLVPDLPGKKPAIRVVFNVAQLTLSSVVAAWLYVAAAGILQVDVPATALSQGNYPGVLLCAGVFALVFPVLNSTFVGIAITLSEGAPFGRVWISNFSTHVSNQVALAMLGVALAQAIVSWGAAALLVFLVPLMVSRGVFHSYVELRETYADTIRGLVAAIEAKDPYTRGHSERVAEYSVSIAESLGLPWARVEQVKLAALLHDLGKIGIGSRVLVKPGRLEPDEMEQIRKHPAIGAEIISSVDFLSGAVPAIVHHHERYDGTGYGSGLAGEKIPLDARILSVADCYDAMTSTRPYKSVLSHREAVAELRDGSGTQFDPGIAGVFITRVADQLEPGDHASESGGQDV